MYSTSCLARSCRSASLLLALSPLVSGSVVRADVRWAIALHGGAGSSPAESSREQIEERRAGLKEALSIGTTILSAGGRSLDAVEAVIKSLEDHRLFNAGRGSVFSANGGHELDAAIMDGRRSCGAVASVRKVRHPISAARLVMEKTDHVLLVGPGADQFAERVGLEIVSNAFFDTEHRKAKWRKKRDKSKNEGGGTVGCVAMDLFGDLAAGTSTGGLSNKMMGRVGDSPIIGAGTFADNATCAVSCTGHGEHFIRFAVAHDISARMAYREQSLIEAIESIFTERLKPGWGGLIAVDGGGNISMQFNTAAMARAAADSSGRFDVHWGVELDD